jgi:membrane-bound lytic murein transglycosylase A
VRQRIRSGVAASAALSLAACAGQVVPPSGSIAHPLPSEAASREPAPLDLSRYIRSAPRTATLPVRQPMPAVPLAPAPFVPSFGATTAAQAGVTAGPPIATLPITFDEAAAGLVAFRASCPSLIRRTDASGLTHGGDWKRPCAAANAATDDPLAFFRQWFEAVQVGDGRAFATGYYVPEITAALSRRAGYETPIHARPDDLIDVDLGRFSDALKGKKVRGRVEGSQLVPYPDRAAIEGGAIDGHARVLAWAADPVALFFLQVQGSGQLRLPDGRVLRIGYDTQNGRDYTGIGALMKSRGLLAPGQTTMQGIVGWLHDHPDESSAIMNENKSYVFFRPLAGDPEGALGLPVIGGTSAAVDPHFIPLGAPLFLSMDRADATSLWVAQDTGGAIKGANRVDTFWGTGGEAAAVAGGMSAHGTAFVLLPVGTLARLSGAGVGASDGGTTPR